MLTPSAICDLYAQLYTSLPVPDDAFDHLIPVDGAYAAIKRIDGVDYVLFRGSVTFLDWIEDFAALANPLASDPLGEVHPGFYAAVIAIRQSLDKLLGPKVVVVGHSLGAGHGAIYAGLRVAARKPVDALVLFGAPRAGGARLASVLAAVPVQSYKNQDASGHDLVTSVPVGLPPLLDYRPVRDYQIVTHAPDPADKWGPFRYHHFGHYCAALGATSAAAQSLPGFKPAA